MNFKTYEDERGKIIEIMKNADVLQITSKKNSKRAQHYHKTSSHWSLITKGSFAYYERPVGSNSQPIKIILNSGDIHFTGPQVEHLFVALEDSEFLCFSSGSRSQSEYESDLIRIKDELDSIYLLWPLSSVQAKDTYVWTSCGCNGDCPTLSTNVN